MLLKKDDFLDTLYYQNTDGITGKYQHDFPLINIQKNVSQALQLMVSAHEKAHQDLNQNTLIGQYLYFLSFLKQTTQKENSNIKTALQQITSVSRICHETLATTLGFLAYSYHKESDEEQNPFEGNAEYSYYLQLGTDLTKNIKGVLAKNAFLFACTVFCFNSKGFVNLLLKNISSFNLLQVSVHDIPDERLKLLHKLLQKINTQGIIDSFIDYAKDFTDVEILLQDKSGSIYFDKVNFSSDFFNLFNTLCFFIVDKLNEEFGSLYGEAYNKNDFSNKRKELLQALDECYPIAAFNTLIEIADLELDDVDKSIIGFEFEKIQLWNTKPRCTIVFPEEINDDLKQNIIYNEDDAKNHHIMLQAVLPSHLLEQYDFYHVEDVAFLQSIEIPMVIMRYLNININDELEIFIIPFSSHAEIENTFEDIPKLFPQFGLFYWSAYLSFNYEEREAWVKFFKTFCWSYSIVNDVSFYMFLKEFINETINCYTYVDINIAGIDYAFLFFMVNNHLLLNDDSSVEEGQMENFIVPGSKLLILSILKYLGDDYPEIHFTNDDETINFYKNYGKYAVEHIFTEDFIWELNNGILNEYIKYKKHDNKNF
jgi:hypothetical protein